MIASNPQLAAMGPQMRQVMQSPMFRQMMSNPETLRMASLRHTSLTDNRSCRCSLPWAKTVWAAWEAWAEWVVSEVSAAWEALELVLVLVPVPEALAATLRTTRSRTSSLPVPELLLVTRLEPRRATRRGTPLEELPVTRTPRTQALPVLVLLRTPSPLSSAEPVVPE